MDRPFLDWLLIGLAVGVAGRAVMPGKDTGGMMATILIGIAGAVFAGFLVRELEVALAGGWRDQAAAATGAVILLLAYRFIVSRRVR